MEEGASRSEGWEAPRRGSKGEEEAKSNRAGRDESERDGRGVEVCRVVGRGREGKLRRFEGKSSKLGQRLLITVWGAVPGRRAVPSARV